MPPRGKHAIPVVMRLTNLQPSVADLRFIAPQSVTFLHNSVWFFINPCGFCVVSNSRKTENDRYHPTKKVP
jgi:hypothetical protein